jgi:hypothetical protein
MRRKAHVRFLGGCPPRGGPLPGLRPASYGPLRLQPLTCKGEVAHEADGVTVRSGPQPPLNLRSPECPTRGLQQGGKPTILSDALTNSESVPRSRKAKRVSESKLHGTVKYNLVALLTRGGVSPRAVGPSHGVVHGDHKSRRSSKQDPSLTQVTPSELGHAARRSATGNRGRGANRPDCTRRADRCVAGNKGSWTKPRPRVMPGIRG